jgi:hypothetical protein
MIWFMVLQVVSILVELIRLGRKSESEKDLEILSSTLYKSSLQTERQIKLMA